MMFYVYYLKSLHHPEKTYIGFAHNLKQRFVDHNDGKSVYTAQYRPWKLIGFLGFDTEEKALAFEWHLKTNAGRVFSDGILGIKHKATTWASQLRLVRHLALLKWRGGSIHTSKDRPWELVKCMAFKGMDCAKQFEKYLKSYAGRPALRSYERRRGLYGEAVLVEVFQIGSLLEKYGSNLP